jgi:hypothetical protein
LGAAGFDRLLLETPIVSKLASVTVPGMTSRGDPEINA